MILLLIGIVTILQLILYFVFDKYGYNRMKWFVFGIVMLCNFVFFKLFFRKDKTRRWRADSLWVTCISD